jgi:hypothetical protein
VDTSALGVIASLIAILSTVVAAVFASNSKTQGEMVKSMREQVAAGERRETLLEASREKLAGENRSNMETIFKLVGAIEKLTDEQARATQLLGDLVYGRTERRQ